MFLLHRLFTSSRFPQRSERYGIHYVAEDCARFSIVKYGAGGKTLAAGILEFSQSAEVGGGDRGGRLNLHARDLTCAAFQYDIHFRVITVPEVMEADVLVPPARLPAQFLECEGL